MLYRATQEGLANAAKHSRARRVRVVLTLGAEDARLTIADDCDGVGERIIDGGFGLVALRERVEAIGGTLTTGNRPEGGFALQVVVPMSATARESDDEETERPWQTPR